MCRDATQSTGSGAWVQVHLPERYGALPIGPDEHMRLFEDNRTLQVSGYPANRDFQFLARKSPRNIVNCKNVVRHMPGREIGFDCILDSGAKFIREFLAILQDDK